MSTADVRSHRIRLLQGLFVTLVLIGIGIQFADGESLYPAVVMGAFIGTVSFVMAVVLIALYIGFRRILSRSD